MQCTDTYQNPNSLYHIFNYGLATHQMVAPYNRNPSAFYHSQSQTNQRTPETYHNYIGNRTDIETDSGFDTTNTPVGTGRHENIETDSGFDTTNTPVGTGRHENIETDSGFDTTNTPVGTGRHENIISSQNVDLNTLICTEQPKYQMYAILTVRISTFKNFPSNIRQTAEQLAQAGFFYSGKEDVVFCFFCGQGLKAWDPEDEPWIEHAKWSPKCRHVLNVKGNDFVNNVREAQSNPELMDTLVRNLKRENGNKKHMINTRDNASSQTAEDTIPIDFLLETMAARSVMKNGEDRETVRKAIEIFVKKNGSTDFKGNDLMELIFEMQDGILKYEEVVAIPDSSVVENIDAHQRTEYEEPHGDIETDGEIQDITYLKTENTKLKERTICRYCKTETVSVVFLPCGHLCCCFGCAPNVTNCLKCGTFIKATVKTYLT